MAIWRRRPRMPLDLDRIFVPEGDDLATRLDGVLDQAADRFNRMSPFRLRTDSARQRFVKRINRSRRIMATKVAPVFRRQLRGDAEAIDAAIQRAIQNGLGDMSEDRLTGVASMALAERSYGWLRSLEDVHEAVARSAGRRVLASLGARATGQPIFITRQVPDEVDPWLEAALEQVRQEGGVKIKGITDTTIQLVRKTVARGLEAGLGVNEMAKEIKRQLLLANAYRAEAIARTESGVAQSAASRAAAKATGLNLLKSWLAEIDGRQRPEHEAAHNRYQRRPIAMDEPYRVGGALMQHPLDPSGPPEQVIQCRCTEQYITATRASRRRVR